MNQIKKISTNIGLYSFVNIIKAIIGFVLVPIYTFYLSPSDFGIVSVISSITGFFSIFYSLSLSSSIIRFFKEYEKNPRTLAKYISTIVVFLLIFDSTLTILLIIFKDIVITPFLNGINFYPFVFIAILTITLTPLYIITQTINQAMHDSKKYSLINFFQYTIGLILTIYCVIYLRLGAFGILLSQLIVTILFFLYSGYIIFKKYKLHYDKAILNKSLGYSIPLIPHSLSGWTLDLIDRVFINNLKSTSEVGIYNVGYKIGSAMDLIVNSVHITMSPWFMENIGEIKSKEFIVRFSEFIIYIYCLISIFVCMFSKELFSILFSKNYNEAILILPYITFSYVLLGMYYFFGYTLFYFPKRTRLINIATFSSAGINVILNIYLIPRFGIVGAAISTLVSYLCSSLITLYLGSLSKLIKYNFEKMYFSVLVSFTISVLVTNINYKISIGEILLKIFVLLVLLVIILLNYKKECGVLLLNITKKFNNN